MKILGGIQPPEFIFFSVNSDSVCSLVLNKTISE